MRSCFLVLLFEVRVAEHQVGRGDDLPGAVGGRGGRQQVAGELLRDEAVERQVAVEGIDDVVAVAPGVREDQPAQGDALGEAGHVEPVPAPALAERRRGEQPVHDFRVRGGRRVGGERGDGLGRRRQAGQVEVDAPQQRLRGGVRGRRALRRLQTGQDEAVERVAGPGGVRDRRHRRVGHGGL